MIIAVDFDGVLFENAFPDIGRPNYEMIMLTRQLIDEGHEVILWTSRAGDRLTEAVDVCEDYGLHFCAVNENAPSNLAQYLDEYPTPSPKVYADLYLEDRDPWFIWHDMCHAKGMSGFATGAMDRMMYVTRRIVNMVEKGEEDD